MILRIARLLLGLLAFTALGVNLANGLDRVEGFSLVNYCSYFTNLSNAFAATVLLVGAVAAPRGARWDAVRGAATFCMTVTGLVYLVLLSDVSVGVTDPWINDVIHRVMPVALLADWLLDPPRRPIPRATALTWLAIPLVYAAYTLIRGPLAGDWYPYPFIDPDRDGGYGRVALNVAVLAVVMAALALLVARLGSLRARRARRR